MRANRAIRAVAAAAAAGVLLAASGCSTTMRDLPIPGTGVSGDTIEIKAEFDEALNLAQGAPVKVNGVDSGKVTSITIDDYIAIVTMDVRTDAELHEGATARLRYTTPLGELFVDVTNPPKGKDLADGTTLGLKQTETAPTVEDALSEASLLINGGGLDQLQTITEELNTAMGGHEGDIRLLLNQASTFLTQASATTSSIDAVLTSLNSLAGTLHDRQDVINRAMKEIRPAAAVLRRATPALTGLLKAVQRFSSAANTTVTATRQQLFQLLAETEPVLAEMASNRGRFHEMLRALVAAAGVLRNVIPGDYASISLDFHLDGIQVSNLPALQNLLDLLGITAPIADVIDQLGLGDLLGGLGGLAPRTPTDPAAPNGATGQAGGPGGPLDPINHLSLDGLLDGLPGEGTEMPSVRSILTDKLYLSAVGVVVVFLIAIAYIFAAVLDQPLTSRPVTIKVELTQTGGLFEGSVATYRGVKVGKVTEIVPADDGVVATVRLKAGTEIPKNSLAKVRSLSPVGEQYLDFQPESTEQPFLESGDTIGAESTDIPQSLSSTVVAVNRCSARSTTRSSGSCWRS